MSARSPWVNVGASMPGPKASWRNAGPRAVRTSAVCSAGVPGISGAAFLADADELGEVVCQVAVEGRELLVERGVADGFSPDDDRDRRDAGCSVARTPSSAWSGAGGCPGTICTKINWNGAGYQRRAPGVPIANKNRLVEPDELCTRHPGSWPGPAAAGSPARHWVNCSGRQHWARRPGLCVSGCAVPSRR